MVTYAREFKYPWIRTDNTNLNQLVTICEASHVMEFWHNPI